MTFFIPLDCRGNATAQILLASLFFSKKHIFQKTNHTRIPNTSHFTAYYSIHIRKKNTVIIQVKLIFALIKFLAKLSIKYNYGTAKFTVVQVIITGFCRT